MRSDNPDVGVKQDKPFDPTVLARAEDVALALAAAVKGASFYDVDHPVLVQQRRDLAAAVRVWQLAAKQDTFIAAAGERLLLTGHDAGVGGDAAKGVCAAMLSKSVVGVRLSSPMSTEGLRELVGVLAEADKRVRASGGMTKVLKERGVRDVLVVEMDLDTLLNGEAIDPAGLEPIIARALTDVLELKARDNRRGTAVTFTLERVTSPSSLGSLLDEMIDGAAPGVAEGPPGPAKGNTALSPLAGASADDLAELCGEAYAKVTSGKSQSPEALTEAAKVLSAALVRLSPEARFKLLQKIASQDKDGKAAEALGRETPNAVLLSAITQVVMGNERDSKLANAVGGLLERLRPVERERQKLLDQLEDAAQKNGRPLDGMFLQQLNEHSQKKMFGALDLPFRETRDALVQAARIRQSTRGQPEIVLRTFSSLREEDRVARTARLLSALLHQERTVVPATLALVRTALMNAAADSRLGGAASAIMLALWNRALRDGPTSTAAQQLAEIAASPVGANLCIALLAQLRTVRGADTALLLIDFVRAVTAVHTSDSFKKELVEALHALDGTLLRALERHVADFSPAGIQVLIVRAGRDSAPAALALAQSAVRSTSVESKEAALRTLVFLPIAQVVVFLRKASGLDGDDPAAQALSIQKEPEQLFRLQKAAIETLGNTRSPTAVPVLTEMLTRTRIIGTQDPERYRPIAGRALAVNNTREAREALDEGKRSKQRTVRLASGATS